MVTKQIQTGNCGTPGNNTTSNTRIGTKIEDVLTGNSVPFSLRCSLQKIAIAKKFNGKKRQVRTRMYGFVMSRSLEAMA